MAKASETEDSVKKVRQISTKTPGYTAKEIRKRVDGKAEMIFLMRVGGVAGGAFGGQTKLGPWVGFKGIFFMLDAEGNRYSANTAFLPATVQKKLEADFAAGVVEVGFKYDIFATETDKNASGYAFICEPVMGADAERIANGLGELVFKGKIPAAQKLLAANKKEV